MSLTTRLLDLCFDFERQMGRPPKAIYLGRHIYADLRVELWAAANHAFGERDKFNGVPIFIVNEEDHANVG